MTKRQLPNEIEPARLADKGAILQGWLSLQEMPRLLEEVVSDEAKIYIELTFAKEEQAIRSLNGKVQATLALSCQRCLHPVEYPVDIAIRMRLISNESAIANVPSDYEPLLITAGPMRLAEIIEEEILLNMPFAAKHAAGKCPIMLKLNYS